MSHATFGSEFGKSWRDAWKSGEERDKEKRVRKRAKRAREDLLMGKIGGYGPEAYESLITERGIDRAHGTEVVADEFGVESSVMTPGDPLEALRAKAKESKGRERLRELASQEGALSRISKRMEAEKVEERYLTRAEGSDKRALDMWKEKLGITTEAEKGRTLESRQLNFATSAGSSGMEWEEFTLENDLDATMDATNPQWMAFKGAREKMLAADRTEQAKINRDAYHNYAFRKGQLRGTDGGPIPLEPRIAAMYPITSVLHGSGVSSTELEKQVTGRGIKAAGERTKEQEKVARNLWLEGEEAEHIRSQIINLTSGPPVPKGMKGVPTRKPWDTALQGMINADYAFQDRQDGKTVVHPRDKWLLMYRDKPEKFDLYSRYVEHTGKFPEIGVSDHRLERELMDIVADTTVIVTGLSANAVRHNSSLTEVGVAVDELIKGGSIKPNQRTAVVSMVMKDVRTLQYADALRAGGGERAYTALTDVTPAGMSSVENAPDGRPRWVIIMKQKEDEEGNPIMVGEYFPHPSVKLTLKDYEQINIRLNTVGAVGRSGVPERIILKSGKGVDIQKLDD